MVSDTVKSSGAGRVRVFCRVRPPLVHEEAKPDCVSVGEEAGVVEVFDETAAVDRLLGGSTADSVALESRRFEFDGAFGGGSYQRSVFQDVGLVACRDVLKGFNGCILAYGQTGAGKTHSLLSCEGGVEDAGLLPRVAASLFVQVAKDVQHVYEVDVAALQVYNEQVDDLLQKGESGQNLSVATGGEVSRLTWERCSRPDALLAIIKRARSKIVYAETKMNKASSRSHAVFQIRVAKRQRAGHGDVDAVQVMKSTFGTLSVVDLAGSERVKRSGVVGKEFKEATNINGSLLVLGNVVSALASRQKHVPFRESKLTRILQGSIGGNCKTSLLVCVSPAAGSVQESIHALEFASRAMSVVSDAKVNEGLVEISAEQLTADLAVEDLQLEEQQRGMVELEKRVEEQQREMADLEQLMEDRLEKQRLEISRMEDLVQEGVQAKAEERTMAEECAKQKQLTEQIEARLRISQAALKDSSATNKMVNQEIADLRTEIASEKAHHLDQTQRLRTEVGEALRQAFESRHELEEVHKTVSDESLQSDAQMQRLHADLEEARSNESAMRQEIVNMSKDAVEGKEVCEKHERIVKLSQRLQTDLEEALRNLDDADARMVSATMQLSASDSCSAVLKVELAERTDEAGRLEVELARARTSLAEEASNVSELELRLATCGALQTEAANRADASGSALRASQIVLQASLESACSERDDLHANLSAEIEEKAQLLAQLVSLSETRGVEAVRLASEHEVNQRRSEVHNQKIAELAVALHHSHDELRQRRDKDKCRIVAGRASFHSEFAWAPLFGQRSRARAG